MQKAQQLGRYHLLDRIAFGGMAEIYRGKTFDRDGHVHMVAVKRVLAHLVEDQDFLQMLVDEAKICAALQHENIARLYEFARAGDEYFLAMEYVDGKDLRAVLERCRQSGRPVPPEHAAYVTLQTALALHSAHAGRDAQGRALRIVHRDVSPSNVLCGYHGEVKLCDFGIAKATLTRVQTKTGVIKGKVKYMSPEQAMGRKLDHRSDLFSLGTVLYEMLTLQPPFIAPTEVELIFAVRDARKRQVRELSPDVPEELARIVDKSMMRSRASRYQSGEEIAIDLRRFLDGALPGYRRTHFSHFMRKIFEPEIERELRQAEGYVIGEVDTAHVGVNLIADVLGPDAPFTNFTPLLGAGPPADSTMERLSPPEETRPSDLHAQATMLFDRRRLGMAALLDYTEAPVTVENPPQATPRPLHDQETALFETVKAPERSIHDEDTGEKELPTGKRPRHRAPAAVAARGSLHERETAQLPRLDPEPGLGDLHDEQTRILHPLAGVVGLTHTPTIPTDELPPNRLRGVDFTPSPLLPPPRPLPEPAAARAFPDEHELGEEDLELI